MAEERQRTERQSEERQERRRRGTDTFETSGSQNLFIPEDVQARLTAQGLQPRWVNDERGRILRLTTKDDYDRVEGVEPVRVGTDPKSQEPIFAHLLAKRVDFIQEDLAKADAPRVSVEKAMIKGKVPTKAGEEPAPVAAAPGSESYVPDGNAITRENRVIE